MIFDYWEGVLMMTEKNSLSAKYQPHEVEKNRYQFWLDGEFFKAKGGKGKKPFSIVIPPPNVTGKLHLGHAWDTALQDTIARMKRMQGYDVLWLPGVDHAGIATQAKVEAKLKESGQTRYDLGREKFLETVWDWKEEYATFIRSQWEKLGLGLDYSRERFTLDTGLSNAVNEVFVTLYEQGIIYRGEYIINWDPQTQTALSDIEVIYEEREGAFYHMKYPIKDSKETIEIATTRPETMLGDTAVAVHPDDERYQHLIGKTVILPIVNREIPIVADTYVDMEFGSGAVKITPAHDPNDFEVGNRHNLERILIMHEDGSMNEKAGRYDGMDRFTCRKEIVKDLTGQGVLFKTEQHIHQVGHSERSGAVVEPYLSTQWFVNMEPLAKEAIQLQKAEDKVQFVPNRFEHTYLHWMENIRDWCISRQLWWGHQIPAWYHKETGEIYVGKEAPSDVENWEQDEDVLDTWFSSALWPFSTMGWPDTDAPDFKRYFPTDVLVTGYDIIPFWVARMIFQSKHFTGKRPFKDALIHGMIRDAQGRKMSKSLGNGIDPMDVIEKYGADSLRYFLMTGSTPGQDLRFHWEKVEATWNFANKVWNASRFALMNLDGFTHEDIQLSGEKSIADKWILTRLNETITQVTAHSEKYDFGEAGRNLYNFIWHDFCDWYIEMAKLPLYGDDDAKKHMTKSVLAYVLDNTLRLLHPFMPFITEEIWQQIPRAGETITLASWPEVLPEFQDEMASNEMKRLVSIIKAVRNTRAEVDTPLSKQIELLIQTQDEGVKTELEKNKVYLEQFCNPSKLVLETSIDVPEKALSQVVTGAELFFPLEGLIDITKEIERLTKQQENLQKEIDRVQNKLANEGFVKKAPQEIVDSERQKEQDYKDKYTKVTERLKELKR